MPQNVVCAPRLSLRKDVLNFVCSGQCPNPRTVTRTKQRPSILISRGGLRPYDSFHPQSELGSINPPVFQISSKGRQVKQRAHANPADR